MYDDRIFKKLTNQRVNTYLKEIAAKCGIDKRVTFHQARHAFATTVTLNNNIPIETVSKDARSLQESIQHRFMQKY